MGAARSLLFVPGHRPDRFDKAAASGAHQVVLDLEDAVAPEAKTVARDAVAGWLKRGGHALVRINAADTAWHEADLAMLQAFPHAGVMLAKADRPSLAHAVSVLHGRPVVALLETVAGYFDLPALCAVRGLSRIAFGSVDFGIDSGIADEGEAMTSVRVQIVLQSRLAGLEAPVDGVSVNFSDAARMREDALSSRRFGFGGKLCIHPAQVGAVNQAFEPSEEERAWARRVLAAFEASAGAATALDGKMIDRPVVERARRIMAELAPRTAA
ncbi:citrate lyase subunit beta / citryl-CoA lyase [Variovorax sp. HW608]|uniref:HpcH/HpaI aldolase/citrate lyase family protein n=1 Tax=Variovorax sp. HW608 TaxID=1034889 RepID=UPI00081F83D6|nr:CoA ester lyase [Variovorax sp. HW608]SCK21747.1 citrate lyase subunit beta / citryl-CoA lyase [Variovorax sp. HW608]